MVQVKLNVALLVLALVLAGGVAAWSAATGGSGDTASYRVEAIGPDGPLLHETVEVADATALSALQAAAERRGVAVSLVEYPGMGTYVRAIGGHEAAGANGWIYEVQRDGEWINGDRSAAQFALQKGDALRWSWTG